MFFFVSIKTLPAIQKMLVLPKDFSTPPVGQALWKNYSLKSTRKYKRPFGFFFPAIIKAHPRILKKNQSYVMQKHLKVRKRAKIRNRYNQAPYLTQDTNGKVTS